MGDASPAAGKGLGLGCSSLQMGKARSREVALQRARLWKRNPPQQQPPAPVVAGDVLVLLSVQVYFIFPVKRKAYI